ncbi:hypothetical protein [Ferruginibacter sp. HRS2-29]|uniref:hypothetical protein n=1 Tax=Ferruginibacter sp. HRS2-29 TaxID=2487334 RepID=UPI0020CD5561|nr:hypothetical protein [Ferruginibacter sp. HRS2-29]
MKTILISLATLAMCVLYSCNEEQKQTGKVATVDSPTATTGAEAGKIYKFDKDCIGVGNLTVPTAEAATMKDDFNAKYVNGNGKITTNIWIDKAVLEALLKHFGDFKKYDGVRFINAVKDKNSSTSLIMVPTTFNASAKDPVSKHANSWVDISMSSTPYEYKDFNLRQKETERRAKLFDTIYGKKPEDTTLYFSSSVWISACVFKSLFDILDAPNSEFDGIRVWQGAYNAKSPADMKPSQYRLRQTTLILVPTFKLSGSAEHRDDWDIIETKTKVSGGGGYNHGELCPKICP